MNDKLTQDSIPEPAIAAEKPVETSRVPRRDFLKQAATVGIMSLVPDATCRTN